GGLGSAAADLDGLVDRLGELQRLSRGLGSGQAEIPAGLRNAREQRAGALDRAVRAQRDLEDAVEGFLQRLAFARDQLDAGLEVRVGVSGARNVADRAGQQLAT